MAHYALLDENNIVTQVITGRNEDELGINWEEWYGNFHNQKCKRTSYNTRHGKYRVGGTLELHPDHGNGFRKNFASVGYSYDENLDAFIPPKPVATPSFILDTDICDWIPPIPMPTVEPGYVASWDEASISWKITPRLVSVPVEPEDNNSANT
ncbi:hypothetical protein EBS02_00170 [bacterium]|jgi:hypothetical protein|nr:hypothetical protein [bacterium]